MGEGRPSRRVIAVVTGSRADYHLLGPLLRALRDSATFEMQLLVTGAHLEAKFGNTWKGIVADGFAIRDTIPVELDGQEPVDVARAMSKAVHGFGDVYARLNPELVMLLGDRYEIFAAAAAAAPFAIPVAHIHGGEVTEGAVDELFRHAISKMAHIHFVATKDSRQRLIRMGEQPNRVHVVGALGLDGMASTQFLDRQEVEAKVGVPLRTPVLVVTYHPETTEPELVAERTDSLLAALADVPAGSIIFTGVNADTKHDDIAIRIEKFVACHSDRAVTHHSLGQQLYFSLARIADVVVGNSSSGIIEMPSLGVPTVNIGDRQKGRPRAKSVIDSSDDPASIAAAIQHAIDPRFRSRIMRARNPYGRPGATPHILKTLDNTDFSALTRKQFYDRAR